MDRLKFIQNWLIKVILKEMEKDNQNRSMSLDEELIHSIGCCRLAQVLAAKRNLDTEIGGIIGIVHDYGRIITGQKENHGEKGAEILLRFLKALGLFSEEEVNIIDEAVANHSSKGIVHKPYDELIKDVDVLDNYFSGKTRDKEEYQRRLNKTLEELDLN
ncbi:MAG: HD domain-containing protein [Clostridia bacterium]|nr:HD domain-containing protein [Clostridia bacterium]